eukprot:683767-Rhodomonas_salina.1
MRRVHVSVFIANNHYAARKILLDDERPVTPVLEGDGCRSHCLKRRLDNNRMPQDSCMSAETVLLTRRQQRCMAAN